MITFTTLFFEYSLLYRKITLGSIGISIDISL